jgi:hypothetical protein
MRRRHWQEKRTPKTSKTFSKKALPDEWQASAFVFFEVFAVRIFSSAPSGPAAATV